MRRGSRIFQATVLLAALPATAAALSASIAGRRLDLDGTVEIREVFEVDEATPEDRTQQLMRLRFAAELTDWLSFDSTTVGVNGGPTSGATKGGTYNLDEVFQDVDPSVEVEEAYLDLDLDPVALRIGKQKIFWGKLDRTQPNDLLNPYRYHDPFLQESAERKIAIPAVQIDYALPGHDRLPEESRLTLVWAPVYVPYRFPEEDSRWFPPAAVPPSTFHVPAGLIELPSGDPAPALDIPLDFRTRNVSLPNRTLENSSLGLRASGLAGGVDLALYYYRGFDVQPAFRLLAEAIAPPGSPPLDLGQVTASTRAEPVFASIQAWGADAAYAYESFTFRFEGAYLRGRPFARDLRFLIGDPAELADEIEDAIRALAAGATRADVDLGRSFAKRDAVEWGIGADYGRDGWFFLLQLNQTDVLRNDVDLLIEDVETRITADARKNFWRDKIRARIVGIYGIESDYSVLLPRLSYYVTDFIDVEAGYLAIFGRSNSVLGQYKKNDQGYLRLRVAF